MINAVTDMISAIGNYQFMQYALIASILASIVSGIIGVIIVEKKLVMMSGGIAHTAYGGVGLGYLLGVEPIYGAFAFSVMAALGIGYIRRKGDSKSDVIIALFWSLGMALGIAFIGFMPGYPPDLNSYLFGNILTVSEFDLYLMFGITAVVLLVICIFFDDWNSFLFDEEFASINGLKTKFFEYVMLILISLTVVVLIRVAGIILVIALLSAPAATASLFSNNLKTRMILASLMGVLFCILGLFISYTFNIASGATIVIVSVAVYFILYFVSKIKRNA